MAWQDVVLLALVALPVVAWALGVWLVQRQLGRRGRCGKG